MVGKRVAVDFKIQPNKRAKRRHGDEDRISRLPDDVLIVILSHLSLNEAGRTSVLSSRWVNLWKSTSRLVFDATEALYKIAGDKKLLNLERNKVVNWVNRVLRSHQSHKLKELVIRFDLNKSSQPAIDYWLRQAFAKQVQKLELDLVEFSGQLCDFPEWSFKNTLQKSFINPHKLVIFNSLKELTLKCVHVSGEVIESFLHNCPLLERVVVYRSDKLVHLEVCGPSLVLKHLEIWFCNKLKSVKVSNSNIVSLIVHGPETLCLENVPMLVEVDIPFVFRLYFEKVFDWISCCITQLETLALRTFELEVYKFPELPKLKKLVFEFSIWNDHDESMIGLTSLLRASPYLEEFVLELNGRPIPSRVEREIRRAVRFPHKYLKVVKYCGYYGRNSDFELLKYILENSASLQKLIIDPRVPSRSRPRIRFYDEPHDCCDYYLQHEKFFRNHAKQQLEGEVPPHIELVIL